MSRVVKLDGPGKTRNQHMRTAAEVIRLLGQKAALDDEARDMAALLVFCFQQINNGIDDSAMAWEKRDYWVKAEQFRERWSWAGRAATDLEQIVLNDTWEQLPMFIAKLLPQFKEIKIIKLTRTSTLWRGAYEKLVSERSSTAGRA